MELGDTNHTTAILFHFVIRNWKKELVIDWYGDVDVDFDLNEVCFHYYLITFQL